MTTRTKRTAKPRQIEALIGSDRVLLKELMKEALQEVLEAEMTEALGAGPGERTADRWACPGSVDGYGLGFQALCCNCLLS